MGRKLMIVGGGCAAFEAACAARKTDPEAEIRLFCRENVPPYRRPALTKMLSGAEPAMFWLKKPEFYTEQRVDLALGCDIVRLHLSRHEIEDAAGNLYGYDRLLLATGGTARFFDWAKRDLPGISGCRTLADLENIRRDIAAGAVRRAAVIGGGLLGLEMADSLCQGGIPVTVIEGVNRLLPRQLDEAGSDMLTKCVTGCCKVTLRLGANVVGFLGSERVNAVELADGEMIAADLVIVAVGMLPDDALAREAGLAVDHGIVADNRCRSSAEDVFAAGDCARVTGFNLGLWMPARDQGIVAGTNMAGGDMVFTPEPSAARLAAFGTKLFSLGDLSGECCFGKVDPVTGSARRIYSKNHRLQGAMLIGDLSGQAQIQEAILSGASPETLREKGVTE